MRKIFVKTSRNYDCLSEAFLKILWKYLQWFFRFLKRERDRFPLFVARCHCYPGSDSWVFSAFFQARNGQHSGTLTRSYWWTVWNVCNITFTVNWRNRDWLVHRTQWDNWTKRKGIDKRWKLIYWLNLYHLYIYSSKFKEKKSNLVKRNEKRKISKV
jgi:hypothetical protein